MTYESSGDDGELVSLLAPCRSMIGEYMSCQVDSARSRPGAQWWITQCFFPILIDSILSHSGATCIYKCRQTVCYWRGTSVSELVAKVALRDWGAECLQHEYDVLQQLSGLPGVPIPYCLGAWNGTCVLITYGVGESVRDLFSDRTKRTPNGTIIASVGELAPLAADVVSALEAVHARGVLHRDICPSNIILLNGRWQLIDFGSAGRVGEADWDEKEDCRRFRVQESYASERLLNTSDPLDEEDDFDALVKTLTRLHIGWRGREHPDMRQLVQDARRDRKGFQRKFKLC